MSTPAERVRENAVGIASMLVTGLWMAALFTGQSWWLPLMLVGYIVVIPLVALLFGDEEEVAEHWGDDADTETASDQQSEEDALQTLRDRYARGELTDEQFERKLERLLETETIEDIEDRKHRARNRELERE